MERQGAGFLAGLQPAHPIGSKNPPGDNNPAFGLPDDPNGVAAFSQGQRPWMASRK